MKFSYYLCTHSTHALLSMALSYAKIVVHFPDVIAEIIFEYSINLVTMMYNPDDLFNISISEFDFKKLEPKFSEMFKVVYNKARVKEMYLSNASLIEYLKEATYSRPDLIITIGHDSSDFGALTKFIECRDEITEFNEDKYFRAEMDIIMKSSCSPIEKVRMYGLLVKMIKYIKKANRTVNFY